MVRKTKTRNRNRRFNKKSKRRFNKKTRTRKMKGGMFSKMRRRLRDYFTFQPNPRDNLGDLPLRYHINPHENSQQQIYLREHLPPPPVEVKSHNNNNFIPPTPAEVWNFRYANTVPPPLQSSHRKTPSIWTMSRRNMVTV